MRVLLLALAGLVVGCGQAGTASPSAPPVAVPTVAATSSGPASFCATTPGTGCTMLPGDYQSTRFADPLKVHLVGEIWTNKANEPDVIVLIVGDGTSGFGSSGPDESVVFVDGAPKLPVAGSFAAVADPEQAKTALAAIPGVTVQAAAAATIAGQPAKVFRVANAGSSTATLWQYPTTSGAGTFDLAVGSSVEVHWLTIGGHPVIVAQTAPTIRLDGSVLDLAPTLQSIAFG